MTEPREINSLSAEQLVAKAEKQRPVQEKIRRRMIRESELAAEIRVAA